MNSQGIELEPEVEGRISNVTFPAGREAVLTCSVKNLGRYKVNMNGTVCERGFILERSGVGQRGGQKQTLLARSRLRPPDGN